MNIGILCERFETDEMGIRLTAHELGLDLVYIPFHKVSIRVDKKGYCVRSKGKDYSKIIENVAVVLNRTQSKNRRFFATNLMEAFGKYVINPSHIESLCYSKLRTLLYFWKEGIETPKTVYIPCDPHETTKERKKIHNEEEIADLIQPELGDRKIVIKPDAGTHGKDVRLAKNRRNLLMILRKTEPSIINPVGILAQELVQKWFYDLRIIVSKEKRKEPYCYPKALARAGFKDFRTNTFLGNFVFGIKLPSHIMDVSLECGKTIGKKSDAWLLALDAIIDVGKDRVADDEYVKSELDKLTAPFDVVKKVKADRTKKRDFLDWNKKLEETFQSYRNSEAYDNVRKVIEESVEKNQRNVMFHEANSCPEFWEQTRLIAGINLAVPLLKCAQSIVESNS